VTKVLILMATDRFSSPARLAVQTIEHCSTSRFTISIGCTWLGGPLSEFILELQRRCIPFHILRQRCGIDPQPLFTALRIMKTEEYDLIESHGYKAAAIACFLKLFTRKPWIAVLHGHTKENWKVELYSLLELFLVRYADKIVTVSAEMRRRLVAGWLPQARTVAIPNAIDPDQFSVIRGGVTRGQLGIADHETLIGIIGRFSPEKGQDLFVEAFNQLATTHPQVKAIFLGEGPTEEQIRVLVKNFHLEDRVIFAGYQTCIADYYPLLDLVVMPSRSEGLPSVALEALLLKIPVVATMVGGIPELIKDEQTGLLVASENPERLAAAIERLLADDNLKDRIISGGYALVTGQFTPDARAKAFEKLYESTRTK